MLKRHHLPLKIGMCHVTEVQTTNFICNLTIVSTFVPTKQNLWEALLSWPVKFEDSELKVLLNQDSYQTPENNMMQK